jgi:hypothetical protein
VLPADELRHLPYSLRILLENVAALPAGRRFLR